MATPMNRLKKSGRRMPINRDVSIWTSATKRLSVNTAGYPHDAIYVLDATVTLSGLLIASTTRIKSHYDYHMLMKQRNKNAN